MEMPASHVVRIRLAGEFDFAVKERLAALLLPASAADVVVLDLTDTTFLDASALGCLISLKNRLLKSGGGTVHLIGVRPNIRKTFSVTGLDKMFEFDNRAHMSSASIERINEPSPTYGQ